MIKKTLLLLVPLLFFIGCEDNKGNEDDESSVDYIELKTLTYDRVNLGWRSWVVNPYTTNHVVDRTCEWIRLYREGDDFCDCKHPENGSIYSKSLIGMNYYYEEM